jgi:phenylacetaldehyde dehydrogenase
MDLDHHQRSVATIAGAGDQLMLIGGERVDASDGGRLISIDPSTGVPLGTTPAATAEDVDRAVAAARATFDLGVWRNLPGTTRQEIMWRVADRIANSLDVLAQLESLCGGMPLGTARRMVSGAVEHLRYFAGAATRVRGVAAELSTARGEFHAYTVREPVGVAALIVPWNTPVSLTLIKLSPALAAGCSIVLKPAEQTPFTALWLAARFEECGVPAGVINVVTGDGKLVGSSLASHEDVDKVSFTGSTEVGKQVARAATGNLKKVTLELGGKSPVLVLPDADIDRAAAAICDGIFINAGQMCIAGSRVYAHTSIIDKLTERLVEGANVLRVGPALDPATTMGPLISETQLARVEKMVQAGVADGAQLLAGGHRVQGPGYYFAPTVLRDPPANSVVVREEIFGPVVTVLGFGDLDDAIAAANDSPYGLASAVWTSDTTDASLVARRLRAGFVWINCAFMAHSSLPGGGYKQSGWGRELGDEGLEEYLEVKTVFSQLG